MADSLPCAAIGETDHPRKIVIVLHGVGSNAHYIMPVAEKIAASMPGTLVLVPEGASVQPFSAAETAEIRKTDPSFDPAEARRWFDISAMNWPALTLQFAFNTLPAIHQLDALIDHAKAQYNLQDSDVALFGFSQGGIVALYTAMQRAHPCAGIVAHSSMYMGLGTVISRPPIFMVTGDEDERTRKDTSLTSPLFLHDYCVERLRSSGFPVTEYICPGLAHKMNDDTIARSIAFLRDVLGEPNTPPAPAPQPPAP